MNKNLFKGIMLGLVLSLLLSVSVSAIAQGTPTSALMKVYYTISSIKINGSDITLDERPFI